MKLGDGSENRRGIYTSLGYRSVQVAEREGRGATAASGEAHERYDRDRLIAQSRQFYRDNPLYYGMIERAISYIVGDGFDLQVKTADQTFNQSVEARWRRYWRRPDVRGLLSGRRVEKMVCRELLVAGDVGLLQVEPGLLQIIESEQITGPKAARDGVVMNGAGRPTSFFIAPYGRGGRIDAARAKSYQPEEFLLLGNPDRPSSTRSVPPCQAAFAMLHRVNDVCDSEAIAWQLLARHALLLTREQGPERGFVESAAAADKPAAAVGNPSARVTEMDYALIFHGEPGDKLEGVGRNIPGANFAESIRMFLRLLGLPLGQPLEIVLLDWTQSNYAQSRAVLQQAYQTYLGYQEVIEHALDEHLSWQAERWTRGQDLPPAPEGEWSDVPRFWIKPTFPWLDQLKEAEAYGVQLDRCLATQGEVCKSRNRDRDEVVVGREREIRDAIARAQAIKAETGVEVPWELFAGLEPPGQRRDKMVDATATDGRPRP